MRHGAWGGQPGPVGPRASKSHYAGSARGAASLTRGPGRQPGPAAQRECMYIATSSEPQSRASPESHMCIYRGTRLAPASESPAGGLGSQVPQLPVRPGHCQPVKLGCRQQRPFWGPRHGLRQVASHGPRARARARARVSAAHPQKLSCSGVPRSQTPGTCASGEGLGSALPHLQRDWARPCRSCDLVTLRSDRRRCSQSRLGAFHTLVSAFFAAFLVCQFSDERVALGLKACVILEPLRAIM
jgi:hypothetical protein